MSVRFLSLLFLTAFIPLSFTENAIAQRPDPNQERLIQPDPNLPQPLDTDPLFEEPSTAPENRPPIEDDTPINVQRIEVIGSTVFTEEDFAPILSPYQGQTLTLNQLNEAADAITQLYLEGGYINSRAVILPQNIAQGVVQIQAQEGSISEVQINGLTRLNSNYIRSRLQQGISTPLQINKLEDQLRLLKVDAMLEEFDVTLRPMGESGDTVLQVDVVEAPPWFGGIFADNYSPASVGSERFGATLGYRNITGLGDTLITTYSRSWTGGSSLGDFAYTIPVNPMNGTLQFRTAIDRNRITEAPFDALGIRGESEFYSVSFRQPIIRTPREELALSLSLDHKDGQTFIFSGTGVPFGAGADANGVTRTAVIRLGQDYTLRDVGGAWNFRSQLNFGTGLLDATSNPAPIPSGEFFSWFGQVQRTQQLSENHLLLIQGSFQLTPDNLLGSETFSVGGGTTLRGYRQSARSGDNGWRFSVENRITLIKDQPGIHSFGLAPFFDLGMVWNNPSNPSQIENEHFLAGLGMGVIWAPTKHLVIRLDGTIPLINIRDRGTNIQDDGLYFTVNYQF